MAWRKQRADWEEGKGSGNKRAFKSLVLRGKTPGIIAYAGTQPVGWCSVAPRMEFVFLARSKVLAPIDVQPVWSVSCLFVRREYRRRGVSTELLRAAAAFVKRKKGLIVEGYPVVPYANRMPDAFAWTGTVKAFQKAGFHEVLRRSRSRPIMRFSLT